MFKKNASELYAPSQASYSREELISFAKELTVHRFRKRTRIGRPDAIRDYLQLHFIDKEQEQFWAAFLDNRHRVISHEVLFRGTIDSSAVYPRVVVQALGHNAAARILAHNHPSGVAEPSQADIHITKKLKDALSLVEIRILDHMIVGAGYIVSLAERGEL